MARIALSEDEKLKRKLARRALKKEARKAAKLEKIEMASKAKVSGRKTKGTKTAIIEILSTDKTELKKMSRLVEDGKARSYGWNMGSYMYELLK